MSCPSGLDSLCQVADAMFEVILLTEKSSSYLRDFIFMLQGPGCEAHAGQSFGRAVKHLHISEVFF